MGNFLTTGFRVSENREETDLNGSSEDMESVDESGTVEDYVMSEASSLLNTNQDHSRDGFEEEENGFHVGDFVWVQGVNRHQWWPGKIYDSSDASDLALKQIQKGTLLVAFCRKETFAWCTPSQLKPFLENLREFSKTSDSSGFHSAVREIGQHVENLLVCEEPMVSSVAMNCGVKKGVLVPDVRREMVRSLVLEKPGIVLEDVKGLAKEASSSDLLEIEVLKRKISAFYRSKGRFSLAKYDDENPYIIGLEDKEDALKFNKSSWKGSLRKCAKFVSKKRKHGDEVFADEEESVDIVVDLSTPMASLCKKVKVDDVSSSVERSYGSGESIVQIGKRERKKSKYLSPEYITDFSCSRKKSKVEYESLEKMTKRSAEKDINFVSVGATAEEILELIRAAALSTQYSLESQSSYEMIREFVSIYRSFTYVNGANYKIQNNNISDEAKQLEVKKKEGENRKGLMEMEWLKKKLEEMRALLYETEGGEVITEELKMRLEEESRNLLDKVRKMTVGSSSRGLIYLRGKL